MNGFVQYPKGFLKEAFQLVREQGGVCIADEVSGSGIYRVGPRGSEAREKPFQCPSVFQAENGQGGNKLVELPLLAGWFIHGLVGLLNKFRQQIEVYHILPSLKISLNSDLGLHQGPLKNHRGNLIS